MKYATLADLKAAYDSGAMSREDPLVLDNDSSYAYDSDGEVFSGGGPQELLTQALDLLGIPWEPC